MNSQSGKGGVAYIMKSEHNLDLPRRLQIEFSRAVQAHTDADGGEVSPGRLWEIFQFEYLEPRTPLRAGQRRQRSGMAGGPTRVTGRVISDGQAQDHHRGGQRTGVGVRRRDLGRSGTRSGCWTTPSTRSRRAAMRSRRRTWSARSATGEDSEVLWGVGMDANIVTASLKAVVSAVNRAPLTLDWQPRGRRSRAA